jgi:hypothetical protein
MQHIETLFSRLGTQQWNRLTRRASVPYHGKDADVAAAVAGRDPVHRHQQLARLNLLQLLPPCQSAHRKGQLTPKPRDGHDRETATRR